MVHLRRRGIRPRSASVGGAAVVVLSVALVAALTGCAGPGTDDGQRVADWIAGQDHVIGAESYVSEDPWNKGVDLTVQVEPDIDDDDLIALADAAEKRARDAGWDNPFLSYDLGNGRSFSNLGGRATLDVFLGIRDDDHYVIASARGNGDCGGIFCVTVDADDPGALLAEVDHLLELADRAGGVQTNLTFTASSADGTARVSAEPSAPIDEAVEIWQRLAATVPIEQGGAWSIEPVGDLPPLQTLELTVPDEAAKAQIDAVAAAQTRVDVRVTVTP
ncbi:hypothetical protein [Herbiconiux ginsengi]|uniref:Lipoprotein n=1 Tax=Herbiconiux ginsengi TaxID=381665 RepID=A0A1H3MDL9_9MICO|nr:hypothetical protein [Herbiconiux ginsengi]SDY74673.1 hypothetical protein SAMN05216554_1377 [Herbiconiux ginsengi]